MNTQFHEDLRTELSLLNIQTLDVYIATASSFDNIPTMLNVNAVVDGVTVFSFTDKYFNQTKISSFRFTLKKLVNFLNKAEKIGRVNIHVSDIGILSYLVGVFPYYQSTQSLTKYNNEINEVIATARFDVTIEKYSGKLSKLFKDYIKESNLDYNNLNNITLEKSGFKFDLWWKARILFRRNNNLWKTVELTQEC